MPAQQAAAWRAHLPGWQQNFVAAARSVLEAAQLGGTTRAAVNRVLEAAGAEPLRWVHAACTACLLKRAFFGTCALCRD